MQEVKKNFINYKKFYCLKKMYYQKKTEKKRIHITVIRKLKDIDVKYVVQNPSLIDGWEESFRKFCLKEIKISNELTNQMIKNSKIINWPNKLNSEKLLEKNKSEFLKLSN